MERRLSGDDDQHAALASAGGGVPLRRITSAAICVTRIFMADGLRNNFNRCLRYRARSGCVGRLTPPAPIGLSVPWDCSPA